MPIYKKKVHQKNTGTGGAKHWPQPKPAWSKYTAQASSEKTAPDVVGRDPTPAEATKVKQTCRRAESDASSDNAVHPIHNRHDSDPTPAEAEQAMKAKRIDKRLANQEERGKVQKVLKAGESASDNDEQDEKIPLETHNAPHQPGHQNCSCVLCKCAFCNDPAGQTLCGASLKGSCAICKKVNQLLVERTVEITSQLTDDLTAIGEQAARAVEDVEPTDRDFELHAQREETDELDRGLLEERRAEMAKERKHKALVAKFNKLKMTVVEMDKEETSNKLELVREEDKKKKQQRETRKNGDFLMLGDGKKRKA